MVVIVNRFERGGVGENLYAKTPRRQDAKKGKDCRVKEMLSEGRFSIASTCFPHVCQGEKGRF